MTTLAFESYNPHANNDGHASIYMTPTWPSGVGAGTSGPGTTTKPRAIFQHSIEYLLAHDLIQPLSWTLQALRRPAKRFTPTLHPTGPPHERRCILELMTFPITCLKRRSMARIVQRLFRVNHCLSCIDMAPYFRRLKLDSVFTLVSHVAQDDMPYIDVICSAPSHLQHEH